MKDLDTKSPHMAVEVFLSVFKCLLIFFTVINLALAGLFLVYIHKSFANGAHTIEMNQDGTDNNQSMING